MKQMLTLAVIGTLAASITACTAGTGVNDTDRQGMRPYQVEQHTDHRFRTRSDNYISPHNNTRMEMSQEIADKLASMKEVDMANVLLTDKNAYVSVVLNHMNTTPRHTDGNGTMNQSALRDDPDPVAMELKNRIADQVRQLHPDVRNVYVSANPDFVQRMNEYAEQFRNGHPLRGLTVQFNTMVDRLFPQSAGTDRNVPNR